MAHLLAARSEAAFRQAVMRALQPSNDARYTAPIRAAPTAVTPTPAAGAAPCQPQRGGCRWAACSCCDSCGRSSEPYPTQMRSTIEESAPLYRHASPARVLPAATVSSRSQCRPGYRWHAPGMRVAWPPLTQSTQIPEHRPRGQVVRLTLDPHRGEGVASHLQRSGPTGNPL